MTSGPTAISTCPTMSSTQLLAKGLTFGAAHRNPWRVLEPRLRHARPGHPSSLGPARPRSSSPTKSSAAVGDGTHDVAAAGPRRLGPAVRCASTTSGLPTSSRSATERSPRWVGCGRACPISPAGCAWFADAFPPRDGGDDGPLCRASRREMQQVHRAWPTAHAAATGEGDECVPERIDGGGYGYGLFVMHDTRFGHFVYHSGGLPGYGSNMRWLPGRGVGVIALGQCHVRADVGDDPQDAGDRRRPRADPADLRCARVPLCSRPPIGWPTLLSDWTDAAADDLFADNVALDESASSGGPARPPRWCAAHGTHDRRRAWPPSRLCVVVATMRHADGIRADSSTWRCHRSFHRDFSCTRSVGG